MPYISIGHPLVIKVLRELCSEVIYIYYTDKNVLSHSFKEILHEKFNKTHNCAIIKNDDDEYVSFKTDYDLTLFLLKNS